MNWLIDDIMRSTSVSLSDMYIYDYRRPDWPRYVAEVTRPAEQTGDYEETRCLQFDRRCFLTGKRLFLKKSVRFSLLMPGPAEKSHIDHEVWINRNDYLLLKLR